MRRASLVLCMVAVLSPSSAATAETGPPWTPERLFNRGMAPVRIGQLPPSFQSPSATECETCHTAEANEWRQSLHRRSWTQPLFQQAYRIEPMAECRNCHQPLTADRRTGPQVVQLRQEGVNCATCHVREGSILAATVSGRAPHPVTVAPVLQTARFCGGCHQFPFPERRGDGKIHHTDEPMQDTLGEWQRLSGGEKPGLQVPGTCQDCHMPWQLDRAGRRHRSHRFLGGYDPALLVRSIGIHAVPRRSEREVMLSVTLTAQQVGHAIPTGDLYRSLVVETALVDGGGRQVPGTQALRQELQRHFRSTVEPDEQGQLRVRRRQYQDDRLVPGLPKILTFRFPARAAARGVRYQISLHRLPPGSAVGPKGAASLSVIQQGIVPLDQGESS